jgi:hypothetical protein
MSARKEIRPSRCVASFSAKVTAGRQNFARLFPAWASLPAIFAYVDNWKWFSQFPAVTCTPETATVAVCLLIGMCRVTRVSLSLEHRRASCEDGADGSSVDSVHELVTGQALRSSPVGLIQELGYR